MIQGSERTAPRNHYTTAPLVITRVTRMTSTRRLTPASATENTSKNREVAIKDHEVGSHKPMNGDTVRGQNKSKQNPNPNLGGGYGFIRLRVSQGPLGASLMDSNTIHGPMAQKTVTQHPGRFWMLTCFDVSC